MSWDLTEEEQGRLMDAVKDVVMPHMTRKPARTLPILQDDGSYKDFPTTLPAIKDDAPEEIKALEEVWADIIDKGAIIGGPK